MLVVHFPVGVSASVCFVSIAAMIGLRGRSFPSLYQREYFRRLFEKIRPWMKTITAGFGWDPADCWTYFEEGLYLGSEGVESEPASMPESCDLI